MTPKPTPSPADLKELIARLEQSAHDFELHNPAGGVTFRGRCDVDAILRAAALLSNHARLVEEIGRLRENAAELLAADDALAAFVIGADPKTLGELVWRGQHGERSARRLRAIQAMRAALSPSQKEGG